MGWHLDSAETYAVNQNSVSRKNCKTNIPWLKKNEKYTARKSALAKKQSKITKKGITVMHMKFCLTQKKALMEKWWNEKQEVRHSEITNRQRNLTI